MQTNSKWQLDVMESFALPAGLSWYDVCGQKLFPLMATPNSYSSDCIAYLLETCPTWSCSLGTGGLEERDGGRWFGIRIHATESATDVYDKIEHAVSILGKVSD
jgi:hypothetical protein